ncbi:MAG: hypothetical protein ACYSWP_24385, partial [Planctomycetota bacterium]
MSPRYKNFTYALLIAVVITIAGAAAGQDEQFAVQRINLQSLRLAIEDLSISFPEKYIGAKEFLDQLNTIEPQLANTSTDQVRQKLEVLYHDALTANPLISSQPILFVTRKQYKRDHHNTATMFQTGEINTESFEGGGA